MGRFKLTYEKKNHLIWGTSWDCTLYDRKYDSSFYGSGDTKNSAKDNAWDKYYENIREQRNSSSSYSSISSYSDDNTSSTANKADNGDWILYLTFLISNIIGLVLAYQKYQIRILLYGDGFMEKVEFGLTILVFGIIFSIVGIVIGFILRYLFK